VKIIGIIPARYASTRFHAKLLREVGGKTILQYVYEQCKKAVSFDKVVIATDNDLIFEKVREFGGEVVMTSVKHNSGTERCAEALELYGGSKSFDYAVNIQGDEPMISPKTIDNLCGFLDTNTEIASVYKKISNLDELLNSNSVKVVLSNTSHALYFSRSPIPHIRDVATDEWLQKSDFFKHLGIYAFRSDVLTKIVKLPPAKLEELEKLEQLRWLSNGFKIKMMKTEFESIGIDTQEDFDKFRQFLG
jgi:3-deoxy-manno-octulosonate cytidylyltransferase (CMP-KDO synthetase)